MNNRFENKGKDQNIAQGEGAVGKQTNILLQPLKSRTLVLVTVLLAGIGWDTTICLLRQVRVHQRRATIL